jgi:2-phospho-L-lactate guanylyltransferase
VRKEASDVTLILIPCKALDRGKSRLASVLDADDRLRLCEGFFRQTLSIAVASAGVDAVRTVSADPRAVQLSADAGVKVLSCEGGDLNKTLIRARAAIADQGTAHNCLILPIDLPYLSVRALRTFLGHGTGVVVASDRRRRGTNALWLSSEVFHRFPFLFGADSLARYVDVARQADITCNVVDDPDLAFDVDEPNDYREWQKLRIVASPSA